LGLEITSSAVRLALIRRSGAGLSVLHTGAADLPSGMVTESYSTPNISDMECLTNALRACLVNAPAARPARAALSLPDGIFRVLTLEFDQLPSKAADRERLIRWRLEKAAAFDIDDTVLRYEMSRQQERGFTVLACLIKRPVLAQYESVLAGLGLEPWIVGLSSFHLLNFYSPLIAQKSSVSCLAHFSDDSFTTIMTEGGGARFYRYKEVKRGNADEIKARFTREIEDSLHFYTHRDRAQTSEVTGLYLTGESAPPHELAEELRAATTLNVHVLSPADVFAHSGMGRESPAPALSASLAAALGAGSAL